MMPTQEASTTATNNAIHWNIATVAPEEHGIYSIRVGGFARYEDGIWFRGEKTPRQALKTQMISATLKPSQRIEWEQDWIRYSGFSVDAFGEPRAIKRDRQASKTAQRKLIIRQDEVNTLASKFELECDRIETGSDGVQHVCLERDEADGHFCQALLAVRKEKVFCHPGLYKKRCIIKGVEIAADSLELAMEYAFTSFNSFREQLTNQSTPPSPRP
jgi:hypothetical protein